MRLRVQNHFWYLYLGIYSLGVLGMVLSLLFETNAGGDWVSLLSLGIEIGAVLGLVGFIRRVPIISSLAWRLFFAIYSLYFAWGFVETFWLDTQWFGAWDEWQVAALVLSGVALSLPMLFALYIYSLKSPEIWRSGV